MRRKDDHLALCLIFANESMKLVDDGALSFGSQLQPDLPFGLTIERDEQG